MQTKSTHAVRTTHVSRVSARREQRGNVIQWRDEALRRRQPNPSTARRPIGEDGSKPLVSERAQNVILLLVAIAVTAVIVCRTAGVL